MRILSSGLGLVALLAVAVPGAGQQAVAPDPAAVGKWSAVAEWPLVAIHAALLPNGKVLAWARKDGIVTTETVVYHPADGSFSKLLINPYAHVFCAGHSFLPDGRLLVAGGHLKCDGIGEKATTFFDFRTNKWTKGEDMNAGRWYPTTTTLASGDVLVVSGLVGPQLTESSSSTNEIPQVWSNGKWRSLEQARMNTALYPFMLLAPNGKVFMAGPSEVSMFLDTAGGGKWESGPTSSVYRDYGSAVLYEPGKILIVGGNERPPVASAETIDLNAEKLEWKPTGSLKTRRRQINATVLADGKVLVTGGTSGIGFNDVKNPVFDAELWDPATGVWTVMAAAAKPRLYHSIALLLPDATVLNAGGGLPPWGEPPGPNPCPGPPYERGPFQKNAQIYSPPYLFRGTRPAIASAPATVRYAETFPVATPDAARISAVTLVSLGAVTHAFNENQGFVRLRYTATDYGLTVSAPSRGTVAPGPYMLFILNGNGVPSVAKIMTLAP
jgi:hypothetical protein